MDWIVKRRLYLAGLPGRPTKAEAAWLTDAERVALNPAVVSAAAELAEAVYKADAMEALEAAVDAAVDAAKATKAAIKRTERCLL